MKGEVLLINPWIYDFAAYNFWMEPLGLLSIGGVLRENGYQVRLIDCVVSAPPAKLRRYNTWKIPKQIIPKPPLLREIPRRYGRYGISPEGFLKSLRRGPRPDLVMVTSKMTYWYPGVFETIKAIRSIWGDVPIALGGTYATLCYDHASEFSGADFVIRGEGEIEALKIADEITGGSSKIERYSLSDLDTLPEPAHDLMPRRNGSLPYIALLTSRGCPMRCTYCASRLLHPLFRFRSPESVIAEIERCHVEFGVEDVAFYDDALLVRAEDHAIPILEMIISRGIKVRFHTPNGLHASLITPEIAELMFRANFKTVRLGLETADEERLRVTGGKTSLDDFVRAIESLKRAGFTAEEIGAYVLAGLPGQDVHEVERTIHFVHRCGVQVKIALFSPIPGTEEWNRAVEELNFPPDADPLLHNNSIMPLMGEGERGEILRLKALSGRLNRDLLRGIIWREQGRRTLKVSRSSPHSATVRPDR